MTNISENEWTIVEPTTIITRYDMATIDNTALASAAEPKIELTIDTKPASDPIVTSIDEKKVHTYTCEAGMPKLERQDSVESFVFDEDNFRHAPRRVRANYIRDCSPSPIRRRGPNVISMAPALFDKSSYLLDSVGKVDTTVDLPRPSRGAVYLTTYPFTNKDVKKWAWLFSLKIEEVFLEESLRGRNDRHVDIECDGDFDRSTIRRARNDSPWYDPGTTDIPSVYLSCALDTDVVPENTADVSYLVVTQNRHRPAGSKLLVAESRKAAGIVMYYEALKGDSIVFVGAVVGFGEDKVHPKKFKKVESLEEALKVKDDGLVGVIC